jgi:prevent-host-death family protein
VETIQASKFKAQCLALMDEVARTGKPLLITKNGKPIAELRPHLPPRAKSIVGRHRFADRNRSVGSPEVILLVDRGRLQLPMPVDQYRDSTVAYGFVELGLDGMTAIRAADLHGLPDDPADRFIVSTALTHDAILVTGDERLLAWKHGLERQDARL